MTTTRFFPSGIHARALLSGALLVLCAGGWGQCSENSSALNGKTSNHSGASGTGGASDAGTEVIHSGDTGGTDSPSPNGKSLCGIGCMPGMDSEPCALEPAPSAGAGGGGGMTPTANGVCQLTVTGEQVVEGTCHLPGLAKDAEPCLSAADCAAGLGCVQPGVCHPYCCGDSEACAPMTFCAAVAMNVDAPAPNIPVCRPMEPCALLTEGGCTIAGETCTIVRADGSTSCVKSGDGQDGDGCPCASGFVCSAASNLCLRLCHTNREQDCPSGYQCSGGSKPYPTGYGVCVKL